MLKHWILAAAFAACSFGTAQAAVAVTGGGPRVGFGLSPDQILFGGHLAIGEVAPHITFDPSLEFGLGDNVTTVGIGFDLHYHFEIADTDWRPYMGAGIGVNFIEVDRAAPLRDLSESGVGGALLLGAGIPTKSGNRFFGELKFGLGQDLHELKMLVGWNFRL